MTLVLVLEVATAGERGGWSQAASLQQANQKTLPLGMLARKLLIN